VQIVAGGSAGAGTIVTWVVMNPSVVLCF